MVSPVVRRLLVVTAAAGVGIAVYLAAGWLRTAPEWPSAVPRVAATPPPFDSVRNTVDIEYDEAFLRQHGRGVESFIREALTIHNIEWRRYRREWFELGTLRFRPASHERDASYTLARFMLRTAERRRTVHVNLVGHQLEVYSSGRWSMPVGGLAYRGSDAIVISAVPGVSSELLGYYLFHEIGHGWETFDVPLRGGNTTYSVVKSGGGYSFDVDAGNAAILEDSDGPAPRSTASRAPGVIARRLADVRKTVPPGPLRRRLEDLILHEGSPVNPSYREKKDMLLHIAGDRKPAVLSLLERYELTPAQLREDDEIRLAAAAEYWRADRAMKRHDFEEAEEALHNVREIYYDTPVVTHLTGAVGKKIRGAKKQHR